MEDSIPAYLALPDRSSIASRITLSRLIHWLPTGLDRSINKLIWRKNLKHLRTMDHRYSFTRAGYHLHQLFYKSQLLATGQPLTSLVKIAQPVTLVAAGPSSLNYDWENLRNTNRFIAVVTGAATTVRKHGIMPDLIVVSDPRFPEKGGHHITAARNVPLAIEYGAAIQLAKFWPNAFADRSVSFVERINKWYGKPALQPAELRQLNQSDGNPFVFTRTDLAREGWSHRADLGFFPSSTVAFLALQILIQLGARDIEIIGMDLGGGTSAYQDAGPSYLERDYSEMILPAFKTMRQALLRSGIKIRNLSPVCPLPKDIFNYA